MSVSQNTIQTSSPPSNVYCPKPKEDEKSIYAIAGGIVCDGEPIMFTVTYKGETVELNKAIYEICEKLRSCTCQTPNTDLEDRIAELEACINTPIAP